MITETNRTSNAETVSGKQAKANSGVNINKIGIGIGALAVVALSMAFPYGLGLLAIVWTIAMAAAVIGTGVICFKIAKELIGGTASFNYSPNMAYLTGKKGAKGKVARTEESKEAKDE